MPARDGGQLVATHPRRAGPPARPARARGAGGRQAHAPSRHPQRPGSPSIAGSPPGTRRKSWVVWEEGGRTPDVVIELLSESTERVDRGEKMHIDAKQMRVAEVYLFDPWTAVFEGYALDPATRSYRRRPLDEHRRLASPVTGLMLGVVHGTWAGVETGWLRWLTTDGQVVPTAQEREAARADQAEARADQEAARAAQEAARAAQEAARAEEALRRVAELEARLGKGS